MEQKSLFQAPSRDVSVRVGPAGWNYKDWRETVYPAGLGSSFDALAFLADYFDTLEINSSFYYPSRPQDAAAWVRRVRNNPRFKFTAKAWRRLSHERSEASEASLARDCDEVRRSLLPLVDSGLLGALLLQFPWSFRYTPENIHYLEMLFRHLSGFPLVVEVRHGGWHRDEFYRFLRENRVSICNVDQPLLGESMRAAAEVTSRLGYFRLHGRNYQNWFKENAGRDARYDYLYPKKEVEEIAELIRAIRERAEETYAITNNHFRGQAVATALDLLLELDGVPPAIPPKVAASYPHLLPLA